MRCDAFEVSDDGECASVSVTAIAEDDPACELAKSTVQWVPFESAVPIEARLYDHLFIKEEPSDDNWEADLNPASEVVMRTALAAPTISFWNPSPETHFQLERIGFFVVDKDSYATSSSLVLNLTVPLKDSKPKSAGTASKSRKAEQEKQLAEKMVRRCGATNIVYLV